MKEMFDKAFWESMNEAMGIMLVMTIFAFTVFSVLILIAKLFGAW